MHSLHNILLFHLLTWLGLYALGSDIIKGKKAPENLMLYMASVQNNREKHICGGFLISDDLVLTAAHCDQKPTSVVLGTHNLKKANEATRYTVVKRCRYPSYRNVIDGDDIMLLKLSKKARLGNRIQPIQLPKSVIKIKDAAKCRVAGWGFMKTGGVVVNELRVVDVPFVNMEVCKRKWHHRKTVLPDNVTCAGGFGTKTGFCQGDSGGPLVCGGMAVGVVSFNMDGNCDYPNIPNVYTDVSKYIQWIKEIRKKKDC